MCDRRVNPAVDRAAAYAWRLLVIGIATVGALWIVGRLLPVVIPLVVALLIARALVPVDRRLRRAGLRRGWSAALTVIGFVVALAAVLTAVGAAVASEFDDLGPTLSEGVDDVENWLVEDSPFGVERADLRRWRSEASSRLGDLVGSDRQVLAAGAMRAFEVLVGSVLTLIVTYFLVKDGDRFFTASLGLLPSGRRERLVRFGQRAWAAVGGYLRGAAMLGLVESAAIGLAMLIVGARLVVPVMVLTLIAAFVPIVGAVVAGAVAVVVTLATAGVVPALVVLVVAVVVQQLDNDLLAPVVYGRALRLHALVILLGIAAGTALFGFVGTFLAVPVLAVVLNVIDEARATAEPHIETS